MATYQLAQLNIALMTAPIDFPVMADFVANLDRINALAARSPRYVWRLQTDDGNATVLRPFGEQYLVNLSVWRDIESLEDYVYRSAHTEILRRSDPPRFAAPDSCRPARRKPCSKGDPASRIFSSGSVRPTPPPQ